MGVLGIDDNPEWHKCDPELVEKSKVKTLLQKAIDHGKSTGIYLPTYFFNCPQFKKFS